MKTVFVDVDTQIDFLFPAGALYVPGAERLLPVIAGLNRFAAAHGIPVISTTDAHAEDDPEFRDWPAHCVAGTIGQRKAAATLLPRHSVIASQAGGGLPLADQIIVEKQSLDVFTNPNFPRLLERLQADRYVVYGVATEYCVRNAVLGLLNTHNTVHLITDAIAAVTPAANKRVLDECISHGAILARVSDITLTVSAG